MASQPDQDPQRRQTHDQHWERRHHQDAGANATEQVNGNGRAPQLNLEVEGSNTNAPRVRRKLAYNMQLDLFLESAIDNEDMVLVLHDRDDAVRSAFRLSIPMYEILHDNGFALVTETDAEADIALRDFVHADLEDGEDDISDVVIIGREDDYLEIGARDDGEPEVGAWLEDDLE